MYSRSLRWTRNGEVRRDSLNKFRPIFFLLWGRGVRDWYCLIENRFLYIKCEGRSIDCTSALIFVLFILKLSRNAVELQTVSYKFSWIAFGLICLSIVPDDFQDNVHDSNVEWRKWIPKNVIECWLKCKIVIESDLCAKGSLFRANECIFALLVAVSRKWMRIFW